MPCSRPALRKSRLLRMQGSPSCASAVLANNITLSQVPLDGEVYSESSISDRCILVRLQRQLNVDRCGIHGRLRAVRHLYHLACTRSLFDPPFSVDRPALIERHVAIGQFAEVFFFESMFHMTSRNDNHEPQKEVLTCPLSLRRTVSRSAPTFLLGLMPCWTCLSSPFLSPICRVAISVTPLSTSLFLETPLPLFPVGGCPNAVVYFFSAYQANHVTFPLGWLVDRLLIISAPSPPRFGTTPIRT